MEYEIFPEAEPDEVSTVNAYSCFSFAWPEWVEGQKKVTMIIEYDDSGLQDEPIHCKAWVQVGKSSFRGLVDEYDVPHKWDEEELIREIMDMRGDDAAFFDRLSITVKTLAQLGKK